VCVAVSVADEGTSEYDVYVLWNIHIPVDMWRYAVYTYVADKNVYVNMCMYTQSNVYVNMCMYTLIRMQIYVCIHVHI